MKFRAQSRAVKVGQNLYTLIVSINLAEILWTSKERERERRVGREAATSFVYMYEHSGPMYNCFVELHVLLY